MWRSGKRALAPGGHGGAAGLKDFSHYPPVLDLPGVADLLGISIEQTRRLSGEGWIDAVYIDGRVFFHRDRVIDSLRSRRVAPPDRGM